MTLNAYLDGWLALLRTRVQPTTHRSYDDMIHSELRPLLGTGMRRGELLGLTFEDLDLTVPQVRVRTALIHVQGRPQLKSTKTGRDRVLALDADTAAALARQPPPRHEQVVSGTSTRVVDLAHCTTPIRTLPSSGNAAWSRSTAENPSRWSAQGNPRTTSTVPAPNAPAAGERR